MNILITGANGFIGRALTERILDGALPCSRLTLVDLQHENTNADSRVSCISGSFADAGTLDQAFGNKVDICFHLAAMPSGSTEQNPDLGYQVNVEGTRQLLERLRQQDNTPRLVFTSSIAVYGKPGAAVVSDDTPPSPTLSYGAHKVMGEALVNDYTRRGWIAGCTVRIPGIVARPPEPNGAVSIFFSDLIRELSAGRPYTCPVSPDAQSWLMSIDCCVDNLLHAADLDVSEHRSWCLPASYVRISDLVAGIASHTGNNDVPGLITYEPDPWVEFNFGSYPPLECPLAESRGFRKDSGLADLVKNAL